MLFYSYCIVVPFVKAGRGSASAVSTMQRLVKGGKCSVAGVCNPPACEGYRLVDVLQVQLEPCKGL